MNKKMLGKMTLMAVAVSMLAMSGTAEAARLKGSLRPGVFEQAWQWLAKLWPGGGGDQEKNCGMIDPNGRPVSCPTSYGEGTDGTTTAPDSAVVNLDGRG